MSRAPRLGAPQTQTRADITVLGLKFGWLLLVGFQRGVWGCWGPRFSVMHEDFGCDLTLHVGIWEFETGHRRYSNKEEHPYSAQDLLNPINPIAPFSHPELNQPKM